MSTSNIKSPNAIRQGHVKAWEKNSTAVESSIQFLKWELNKLSLMPISFRFSGMVLSIFYYRWIQLPFNSKVGQRSLIAAKREINISDFLTFADSEFTVGRIKTFNKQKRRALIDIAIQGQRSYQIPFITQVILAQRLRSDIFRDITQVYFVNVFKQNVFLYRLIDLKKFVYETPLIKSNLKSIYHVMDMVAVADLLSLKICEGGLMGKLIGKILERSSKKGLFIRSLRIMSKLPTLIKKFEIKEKIINGSRNWNWGIRVTGKIGGMGRTKVYNIFSSKIPLHTINNNIDYSETIVNTKAGTFSVKVWILE